jgi:hypothetical protein
VITIVVPAATRYGLDRVIASSFSCTDASGVAECAGPAFLDTSSLGLKTFTVNARDNAGNTAMRQVVYEIVNDSRMLVLDRDALSKHNPPDEVTRQELNLDKGEVGLRVQIPFFAARPGQTFTLGAGIAGNEGWFGLNTAPATWVAAGPTADGNVNYTLAGPGLGSGRPNNREDLLKVVPHVAPLQQAGLELLVGQRVYAVVMDGKVMIKTSPFSADLRGKNLGVIAFEVVALVPQADGSLPAVQVKILDAVRFAQGLRSTP